jgi:alpha-mannosidase
VVHYTNLLAGRQVNAFYSTPEAYADAKQAEGVAWSVKTNNFYPYADKANS